LSPAVSDAKSAINIAVPLPLTAGQDTRDRSVVAFNGMLAVLYPVEFDAKAWLALNT